MSDKAASAPEPAVMQAQHGGNFIARIALMEPIADLLNVSSVELNVSEYVKNCSVVRQTKTSRSQTCGRRRLPPLLPPLG